MSAPASVRTPATIHTANTPPTDGTAPLTTDGCTKIDAPMIVPTTIDVARMRPRDRWRAGAGRSELLVGAAVLLREPERHRVRRHEPHPGIEPGDQLGEIGRASCRERV